MVDITSLFSENPGGLPETRKILIQKPGDKSSQMWIDVPYYAYDSDTLPYNQFDVNARQTHHVPQEYLDQGYIQVGRGTSFSDRMGTAVENLAPAAAMVAAGNYIGNAINGATATPLAASGAPNAVPLTAAGGVVGDLPVNMPTSAGMINGVDLSTLDMDDLNTMAGAYNTLNTTNAGNALNALSGETDWQDLLAIAGGSLGQAYLSDQATDRIVDENARQFDATRADFQPYRDAGINALNAYQDTIGEYNTDLPEFTASPGSELPQYQSTGRQLNYMNEAPIAQYEGGDRFEFNLEDDPVYQFGLDQTSQAVQRAMAARGHNQSGNLYDELARKIAGYNAQYQDDAFRRQLSTSDTNYGRGVTDYNINRDIANTMYDRGVTDFGIRSGINTENYNRNVGDYGINTNRANLLYGRDTDAYNRNVGREGTGYQRRQNYLSQLGGLADTGRGAAGTLAQAGQYYTGQNSNAIMNNAMNINDALQGGISNYLTYRNMRR